MVHKYKFMHGQIYLHVNRLAINEYLNKTYHKIKLWLASVVDWWRKFHRWRMPNFFITWPTNWYWSA